VGVVSPLWGRGCKGRVGAEVVDVQSGGVGSEKERLRGECVDQSGWIRCGAIVLAHLAS